MSWWRLSVALIALGFIFFSLSDPPEISTLSADLRKIADQRPDAFMAGIHQKTFSEVGTLKTTLIAESLLDFGSRANAKLEAPKFWLERNKTSWYIEGDHGELSADRKLVSITHNVSAKRSSDGRSYWELSGDQLLWDQTTDLITSSTTTKLVQGGTVSIGEELLLNLNKNEYRLDNKVKTQWRNISSSE